MSVEAYFKNQFGYTAQIKQFTPGRVNLIGEHIDYNGGTVLPMAITKGVQVALAPRQDTKIHIASDRFPKVAEGDMHAGVHETWAKYAFYACKRAVNLGWMDTGVDLAISSNLVDGAGLSSSAAVIVGVLKALRTLSDAKLNNVDLAVLARKIENEDMGVPCGIMDQMVVSVASPQEAIWLDTQDLSYEPISLTEDYIFPVVHSGARRQLADGRYKARKEECDLAKQVLGTNDICKLSLEELAAADLAPAVARRVHHCITENTRVLLAVNAMRDGNVHAFADHMNKSHISMRDDFEMSVEAVDMLVEISRKHGAIGARLTGGGFGGCVVSCVSKQDIDTWAAAVQADAPNSFRVV